MKTPFKITRRELKKYPELEDYDLGYYGIIIKEDGGVLVYESKAHAQKAYDYFKGWK